MTDAQPTERDRRNAETRQAISERMQRNYDEAQALADTALGSGYQPWMRLDLIDSNYHRSGDNTAVATVFKVYRGEQRLSENSVFIRRMPDGTVRHAANYEELFGALLHEPHPTRKLELLHDQVVAAPRWTLCWSALELYEPRTAEELAAARERRQERAVEKEAEGSLFASQIRAEGFVQKVRRR